MKSSLKGFVIGLAVTFWCAAAQAENIHIVVFGDSLTFGYQLQPDQAYPAKLDHKLKEIGYTNVDVTNLSKIGETTAGALERVSSVLVKQPDIVVVELGFNDAQRGIAVDLIYKNLASILSRLSQQNVYIVLMGVKAPANMGYTYSGQLDAAYARLAEAYRVGFYPSVLEGISGQQDLNLADAIHPNGKGVDVMVEGTYRLVDEGLRWKWNQLQYQQYQEQYQQYQNQIGAAPTAPPDLSTPAPPAAPVPSPR